ncbi:MAG: 6-phospho-3-hexuloisomerase [Pedobacter sp.]|nr:MAG: 6-phospho-3-hexuloisomerase [Pedobacter sp.]
MEDLKKLGEDLAKNMDLILTENQQLAKKIDVTELITLVDYIQKAPRIFLVATGRSGFALRGVAMRLMHLGLTVYFVGDTTTPAITEGDLLIAASGSGTTASIVKAAEKSISVKANVFAITTDSQSALAQLANAKVIVPAQGKQDFEGGKSQQYAGSLFEQFLLLVMDAVFQSLWKIDGSVAEKLWARHANLE